MPPKYGRMVYVCGITHKNCDLGGFCESCQIAKEYEAERGWNDSLPRTKMEKDVVELSKRLEWDGEEYKG